MKEERATCNTLTRPRRRKNKKRKKKNQNYSWPTTTTSTLAMVTLFGVLLEIADITEGGIAIAESAAKPSTSCTRVRGSIIIVGYNCSIYDAFLLYVHNRIFSLTHTHTHTHKHTHTQTQTHTHTHTHTHAPFFWWTTWSCSRRMSMSE